MTFPIDSYGIIMQRRSGKTDNPFLSVTETISPTNTLAVLKEIPDKFNHVTIPNMYEIYDTTTPPSDNEFYVNYSNGNITFSANNNGKQFTASYLGTGAIYISAQRIATAIDDNGNITQFLNQLTDSSNSATSSANTATTNANNAATNATNQATYATQQGDYAKSVGDNVQTYWQTSVATYSDIATTYPAPQNGWTVQAEDSTYIYRYESSSSTWVRTQKYNDTITTSLQNRITGQEESQLVSSLGSINIDGMTLGNITIPQSNVTLGTVTLA